MHRLRGVNVLQRGVVRRLFRDTSAISTRPDGVYRAVAIILWLLIDRPVLLAATAAVDFDGRGRKFNSPVRRAELRHPEPRREDASPPRASTARP